MYDSSAIIAYLLCPRCIAHQSHLAFIIGLADPVTLRAWCLVHQQKIIDFELAQPVQLRENFGQHASGIVQLTACRDCMLEKASPELHIGLIDSTTLRIWCERHDRNVGDYVIAKPLIPRCDACGEVIDSNHSHH